MDKDKLKEAGEVARILLDARDYIKSTADTDITLLLAEAVDELTRND